jgi:hypothetical protein
MAKNAKNPANDKNTMNQGQNDKAPTNQSAANKKAGFEEGTGNNNQPGLDPEMKKNQNRFSQDDTGQTSATRTTESEQQRATNVDRKVTNQAFSGDTRKHVPMDDDADTTSQKNDPEINPPQMEPEKTEKKLPEM